VESYIDHRLKVSGRLRPLFTSSACQSIAEASRGIPRSINILCDTVLVYGFSGESAVIDVDLVEEVIRDQYELGVLSGE
jgi:general secretion pathway protein A